MDQNPDAVDQEEMAFAETPSSHNDPGDESDASAGATEVPADVPDVPAPPPAPIPAVVAPVGDYAEIADLMAKIQKRHSRNVFDSVSIRWWMRMQEICKSA